MKLPARIALNTELETMICGECGIAFAAPAAFWRDRRNDDRGWYCPNGHCRVFSEKESDQLRRELAAKNQELAQKIAQLDQAEARARDMAQSARASRAALTRVQQRVGHGVCPCCNRTFQDLQRHMHGQHPDWAAAEAGVAPAPPPPVTYTCRICKRTFATAKGRAIHMGHAH